MVLLKEDVDVGEVVIDSTKEYGRELVRLDQIVIDANYQRDPAKQTYIKNLAARWDDKAAHVITLSLRDDGFYYCIDGQRRVAAARLVKGTFGSIEAMIYFDLTPEEEAKLFRQLQERQQLTAMDVWKARLVEHEPTALSIQRIARDLGLEVTRSHGTRTRVITAVGTLDKVYHSYGGERLRNVLRLLRDGFGDDSKTFSMHAIEGMSMFLARYPNASEPRIIEVLKKLGPLGMFGRASNLQQAIANNRLAAAWGQSLRTEYNRGLRTSQLAVWPEKTYDSEAMRRASAAKRKSA